MDQQPAFDHLRLACVPADNSDAAVMAQWGAAQQALGAPFQNAGNPEIKAIPAAQQQYVNQLQQLPWWITAPGAEVKLIEIEPLLAYQFVVDTHRSQHHCAQLSHPPTLDELMPICLPLTQQQEAIQIARQPQSMLVKARSLNLTVVRGGMMDGMYLGIQFGLTAPFVHVVRHNNRCYLHNGFHRAYGARVAGATHLPCVFRDVPDHASVGIKQDGSTFATAILESQNPPTLAHFTQGRAHAVSVRSVSRVLHVSWADYAVADE
jgi:hypothetical protein